jgi:hypothetical protein
MKWHVVEKQKVKERRSKMPFKSEAQRRYMWLHHPEIAKRWAEEYRQKSKLPYHKKKKESHHGKS